MYESRDRILGQAILDSAIALAASSLTENHSHTYSHLKGLRHGEIFLIESDRPSGVQELPCLMLCQRLWIG
jgi:hypothetical protein